MAAPLTGSSTGSLPIADSRSLDALRSTASRDPKAVVREAAKQFEALFLQQLMKSMRESNISSGMLDNAGTKLGNEMLDTQFANKMTGLPGGLGEMIARQLERQITGVSVGPTTTSPPAASLPTVDAGADLPVSQRQADFLRLHQGTASQAELHSGIPAAFMVAQAAHESGWGRREIRNADGSSSHNLFGIKAGAGWNGPVAEVTTTEYVGGEPQKVTARFRAYASYAESFQDYARMIKESPRYAGVFAQATSASASPQAFALGLQRAGYATDPAYADKLTRVINTTLRLQRIVT
ncbi:MAG: flagellar assembly peptidoglycan hydrolase FlgJ [Caldimonas sp.]